MTFSLKLGAEFADDCARDGLTDAGVRTHVEALGWLSKVEDMDLRIPKHLVRRFAGSPDYELGIKCLVAAGFWRDDGEAYVVIHHADVVRGSIAAQGNYRARNRKAQQAWRRRQQQDST